jgi:nucleoside-diphosphate kinase
VAHLRQVMGATDSRKADPGTVRRLHGTDIERNAIHGSDSSENAAKEVGFFFAEAELI